MSPHTESHQSLDDDDVASADNAPPKQLGSLRCEVFRVARLGRYTGRHDYKTPSAIKEDPVLHERTKMAGAHRVQCVLSYLVTTEPPSHSAQARGITDQRGRNPNEDQIHRPVIRYTIYHFHV